jgi:hypothetical protein
VLPFIWQSVVHAQPPVSQVQLEGWHLVGSGSGVQLEPAGQLVEVQLTGLGLPLHSVPGGTEEQVPATQATAEAGQLQTLTVQHPAYFSALRLSYALISEDAIAVLGQVQSPQASPWKAGMQSLSVAQARDKPVTETV